MNEGKTELLQPPLEKSGKLLTWDDLSIFMESNNNLQELLRMNTRQQQALIESQQSLIGSQTKFQETLEDIDERFVNGFKSEIIAEVRKGFDSLGKETRKVFDSLGGTKNILIGIVSGQAIVIIALISLIAKIWGK